MNKLHLFRIFLVLILVNPIISYASPLSDGCANYRGGGYLHTNVTVKFSELSTLPNQGSCLYMQLSDSNSYYHICPTATSNFQQITTLVNNATLLQNPVNICTSGQYFLGIEYQI